ncbi:MAG: choice-of-anchor tandem repeat GloVer-containing protein [Bryobacteraceae bacterium]
MRRRSPGDNGSSTIFEMTPSGVLTTVFAPGCTGNPCQDGDYPVGIVQANNGYIFGAMTGEGAYGAGTIFKMTPAGTFTTLYNFCPDDATCDDGKFPVGLVQAANGDLYGTTQWGGLYNRGTVFKITASGIFTSIYSFCLQEPCADGANPLAGLVQEANGDLVGTTEYGGTVACCSSFYYPMAVARSSK